MRHAVEGQLGVGIGHSPRRVLQTGGVEVGPERMKKIARGTPRSGVVDLAAQLAARGWLRDGEAAEM
jgi:hypothetical protein